MRRSKVVCRIILIGFVASLCGCAEGVEAPGPADAPVSAPDVAGVPDADQSHDGGGQLDGPEAPGDVATGPCAVGAPCDDDDPCTVDDGCTADGGCAGVALDCDDGLPCTDDRCDDGACAHDPVAGYCVVAGPDGACASDLQPMPGNDCLYCDTGAVGGAAFLPALDGALCEDGDLCTAGEVCADGACEGGAGISCPGGGPCAVVGCESDTGCTLTPLELPCDDGNPCTVDDACAAGLCAPGDPLICDDEDACTVDTCDPSQGCQFVAGTLCDDGLPCTLDLCDASGGCSNTVFTGPCEDGDLCTEGETCDGVTCAGGLPVVCEEDGVCTQASCDPSQGCLYILLEGSCDDGFDCTQDDTCEAGVCVGAKSDCDTCPVPVTEQGAKVVTLEMSGDGMAGSGLDVDEDPTTCAPSGSCGGGVDNALSVLAPFVNDPVAAGIEDGVMMYVIDVSAATLDGEEFPVYVVDTDLSAASGDCDWMTEVCEYVAIQPSFDAGCEPFFGLPNAVIDGFEVTAGGPGHIMTMALAIDADTFIPVTVHHARLQGTLTFSADGAQVTGILGMIAGATPKEQLIETFLEVEDLLPLDGDALAFLLDAVIENDIDLDGDGVKDAASLGMRFETIPGHLVAF